MSLPFTHHQFLDVFAAYNSGLWPAALGLWLLTATAIALLAARRANSRLLAALLSIHWLWSGAVYHLGYFASINPAAPAFGGLFLVQAILAAWFGVLRPRLTFAWDRGRSPRQILSVFLCLYALAYPFLALASGLDWPRIPTFGVPCPTAIFTVGLLLALEPPQFPGLSVIPLLWTAIGGSAAILLGVLPDYMLLVAGAALLIQLLSPRLLIGARAA